MMAFFRRIGQKRLLRAGAWYVFGNLAQRGISFVILPIIARLLLPEQIGMVAVWQGWVSIFAIVLTLNLSVSVTNAATDFDNDAYVSFLSTIMLAALAFALFGTLFAGLLSNDISATIFGLPREMLLLAAAVGGMNGLVQIRIMAYRQKYDYVRYNLLALGGQVLSIILGIVFILLPPRLWSTYDTTYGQPLGFAVSYAIMAIFVIVTTLKATKLRFQRKYAYYALAISAPLILHTISHSLISRADTYLISQLIGERETGIYSIAYRFGEVVLAVWTGTTNVWTVWFFERMKSEQYSLIRHRARQYIYGFAAVTLVLMFAGSIGLRLLTPPDYWEAIGLVPIIMSAGFFAMLYGLYIPVEYYFKRTSVTGVITLIAAVVNIGLNLLLLPIVGYQVAAITTVIAYAVMFICHALYAERTFDIKGLFSMPLLISAGVLMTGAGIGISLLMRSLFAA